jgi:hypothetical protein
MTSDQRTTKLRRGRAWPLLDPLVFVAALLLYAVGAPLGLARVDAASQVAAAITLDAGGPGASLFLFATRLAQYLPMGDLAWRANLVSGIACALAMSLLARLSVELVALFRPPPSARLASGVFSFEPVAAAGAALAAALTVGTFEAGTTPGPTALTLALLLGGFWAELALLRDAGNTTAGLVLAALAGVSAGVGPMAGPVLWPILVGLALWALRKGARWPLFAPLCLVASLGSFALANCAASPVPLSIRDAFVSPFVIAPQGRAALWTTALEIADQVGVVGVLLAAIGLLCFLSRAALVGAWLALTLVTCLLFANLGDGAGAAVMSVRAGLPAAIAVTCLLGSVGLAHVSLRMGRARLAAALALAVILLFSPAMDGSRARWTSRPLPMRLLDRALDRVELRSAVDPGTPEMAGLFRLAHAIGLRPDLEIAVKR